MPVPNKKFHVRMKNDINKQQSTISRINKAKFEIKAEQQGPLKG